MAHAAEDPLSEPTPPHVVTDETTRERTSGEIVEILRPFVPKKRLEKLDEVLSQRVGNVRLVFENMCEAHNGAACMRSAECLGIQHIYMVESFGSLFATDAVSRGAEKWLTLDRHKLVDTVLDDLASQGYTVYATDLSDGAVPLSQVRFAEKSAIVFGNERRGISKLIRERADVRFHLPMRGHTQSFNLSVTVGMTLSHLETSGVLKPGTLSASERDAIMLQWLLRECKRKDPAQVLADHGVTLRGWN